MICPVYTRFKKVDIASAYIRIKIVDMGPVHIRVKKLHISSGNIMPHFGIS